MNLDSLEKEYAWNDGKMGQTYKEDMSRQEKCGAQEE
jgi:hypothetical protein